MYLCRFSVHAIFCFKVSAYSFSSLCPPPPPPLNSTRDCTAVESCCAPAAGQLPTSRVLSPPPQTQLPGAMNKRSRGHLKKWAANITGTIPKLSSLNQDQQSDKGSSSNKKGFKLYRQHEWQGQHKSLCKGQTADMAVLDIRVLSSKVCQLNYRKLSINCILRCVIA
jgi:hypothetical protein